MDVSNWRESDYIDLRPDLVMYPTDIPRAREAYFYDKTHSKLKQDRKRHIARCAWSWMMTFVECKCNEDTAPFFFTEGGGFLREGSDAVLGRAQIAKYASEIQLRQHRTHLFSMYFCHGYMRILRWDRTGCVVSEPVDMINEPTDILNFIYRLGRLTREQLGYDATTDVASATDIRSLERYQSSNADFIQYRNHMLHWQKEYPIHKVSLSRHITPSCI